MGLLGYGGMQDILMMTDSKIICMKKKKIKLSRKQFNDLKMYLNRLSGKLVIDSLTFEEMKEKIYKKLYGTNS